MFFLNNHFEVGFILTKLKRNFYTRSLFHTLSIYSNNVYNKLLEKYKPMNTNVNFKDYYVVRG